MAYTPTGPFVTGTGPGINAPFLNNVENFLVLVNSAATDANITSDGAGNESITGNISLTTNNKSLKGKDHAGVTYPIASFDGTTNKQLNILDGTSGQLANIKSNTKVNGTFEATGATTLDSSLFTSAGATISGILTALSSLGVQGSSSLDNTNITTDGTGTLQLNKSGTNFSGTVSGTCAVLCPLWGPALKIMVVSFLSYSSASAISFTLPTTMARGWFFAGNQGGASVTSTFKNGGVAVNVRILTGLGSSGGTTVQQSNIFQDSIGSVISTIDSWTMTSNSGGSTSSSFVLIGV